MSKWLEWGFEAMIFTGRPGNARLTVGLDDLGGLFHPK